MYDDLEELTKISGESLLFDMDFSNKLTSTESISSILSVSSKKIGRVENSTDITILTQSYLNNRVQIRIVDGTPGEQYLIEISVLTSLSNTKIGQGLLRVL